jgi:hypothetical protein
MFKKKLLMCLLILPIITGCLKKEEEEETKKKKKKVTMVDVPAFTARCKFSVSGFCDNSVGVMHGKHALIYIFNAKNNVVAIQTGQITCGDEGGHRGNHCKVAFSADQWVDGDLAPVDQIPQGTYSFSFLLDKEAPAFNGTYPDIENLGTGDMGCSFTGVKIGKDATDLTDTHADNFTCFPIS